MDYVVGSVAALITGNVTPSRPRLMKRALTPTKHQPSPNVTPKSEFVEDRSIFLSPSMQKKKAIVKKSPKRIFQNPDLENTEDGDVNISLSSPKADKVKKHLKDDLDADCTANTSTFSQKSPKNKGNNKRESISTRESDKIETEQNVNESTPKKKKKKQNSESEVIEDNNSESVNIVSTKDAPSPIKSPKKRKLKSKSIPHTDCNKENNIETVNEIETPSNNDKSSKKQKKKLSNSQTTEISNEITTTSNTLTPNKKNKKRKKKVKAQSGTTAENIEKTDNTSEISEENQVKQKKKNKKRNKSKPQTNKPEIMQSDEPTSVEKNESDDEHKEDNKINPNAITDKESDSEHESDDEIESENEEINKKVLESEKPESSDDEDDDEQKVNKVEKKEDEKKEAGGVEKYTEEEIKRTLFVGNVPFSAKCKKEIKKIFNKHGQIETIRIRTVPIKDGRYTPKLALIKNELHPERTTVNVYIKYVDADSVEKALSENNTVLNEHHLRVSRSSSTGAEHDPRCSVFIGNLPFAMEDEALRAKFEKCGEINSVRIIRDKKTNAGKGFGYVNFESKDGVELALALTEEDLTVKNRILRVKRCTQVTNKKKPAPTGHYQGNKKNTSRPGNNQANQRVGFRDQRSGNQSNQHSGGFRSGGNQGNQDKGFRSGGNQGNQDRGFKSGGYQSNHDRGGFKKFGNQRNDRGGQKNEEGGDGAFRRIMNKRKFQEGTSGGDEPANKRPKNINQPHKEKKTRKEFVGMTAEKKKKHKFDKGQKKKKALSEILTK